MAPATATADPEILALGYQELPIDLLEPSSLNPRRHITNLDDLTASIREKGVLEPLLGRPTAEGRVEIVAGERRWHAAQAAGLSHVPVIVRDRTDAQLLEDAIIENNQRADVHPLDEAEAFERLGAIDRANTPEVLASKIGRPLAYVRNRLRLLRLTGKAREAFGKDEITIGHAERIARLPAAQQDDALEECFYPLYRDEEKRLSLAPIADLDDWIQQHTVIDLKSPDVQADLPELTEQVDRLEAEGATIVQLSTGYQKAPSVGGPAPLPESAWRELTGKPCAHATQGVVVYGERNRAQLLTVCLKSSKCPKHWPPAPKAPASGKSGTPKKDKYEVEREKQAAERRAWAEMEPDALVAIAIALQGRKADHAYFLAAVERHERERIAKVMGEITDKNFGQALWLHEVLRCNTWNPEQFAKEVKDLTGFNVAAWRKEWTKAHPPAAAALAPAPTKKPKAKKATKAAKRR